MQETYVGKTIRDYEVLERIDGGGMGHIYRARHQANNREHDLHCNHPY